MRTLAGALRLTAHVEGPSRFKETSAATELIRELFQLGHRSLVGATTSTSFEANSVSFVPASGQGVAGTHEILAHRSNSDATTVTLAAPGPQGLLDAVFAFLERQGAYSGPDKDLYLAPVRLSKRPVVVGELGVVDLSPVATQEMRATPA